MNTTTTKMRRSNLLECITENSKYIVVFFFWFIIVNRVLLHFNLSNFDSWKLSERATHTTYTYDREMNQPFHMPRIAHTQ